MYYELYIDVLFLVNFMMDSLLLLLVRRILKCGASYGRIFLGALAGSVISCILIVTPFPLPVIKIILFHTAVNSCMIAVAFQVKSWKVFIKAILLLYICAFLMGGILQWVYPWVKTGSIFFAAAVLSYFLIKGIWRFLGTLSSRQQKEYRVTLVMGEHKCTVLAWIDTGNALKDPLSGQPVHVLEQSAAETLLENQKLTGLRYIPFRTIQGDGVLPVVRIEKMCIHAGQDSQTDFWIEQPVIGISEERIFAQEEYQMLLNPEILGGI